MKRRNVLKSLALALGLTGATLMGAYAQETTLRAVSFTRLDDTWGKLYVDFVNRINEKGKGVIQVDLIGGPEVMNQFEMGNAVKTGVVDMAMLPGGFYQNLFPASQALSISTKSPTEHRENGAWEELNRLHNEQVNSQFLANFGFGVPFHIYSSKRIDKADLNGVKLRLVPIYRPLFDALGATSLQTQHSELYTAMERGVVDGYGWSLWGLEGQGLAPVTEYRLEPGFYNGNVSVLTNLDKWNTLNDDQKAVLNEVAVQFEKDFAAFAEKQSAAERKFQEEAGVEVITLEGAEAEKFTSAANDAGWEDVKAKAPNDYAKLRELME